MPHKTTGHVEDATLKKEIIEKVIKNVIPANMMAEDIKYVINGTGRFVIGGTLGRFRVNWQKNHR